MRIPLLLFPAQVPLVTFRLCEIQSISKELSSLINASQVGSKIFRLLYRFIIEFHKYIARESWLATTVSVLLNLLLVGGLGKRWKKGGWRLKCHPLLTLPKTTTPHVWQKRRRGCQLNKTQFVVPTYHRLFEWEKKNHGKIQSIWGPNIDVDRDVPAFWKGMNYTLSCSNGKIKHGGRMGRPMQLVGVHREYDSRKSDLLTPTRPA